ncbi:hypothetical protein ANCDUO_06072 [Ancylostoma duodenale]|uniref:Uncharacterized protein n=1 Tax=Ancylostoma duodenale TaxID=51022 RepID=A0A0C2GX27_9BILA|nr:hypothetical protein ANCDUO_06072 [Ancylostoma duodenale]
MFVPRMLICGILLTCTLLWFYRSGRDEITPAVVTDYLADDIMETSAPDKDPFDKCILPNYDPWDEHVIPYVDQNYNPLKYCNHSFKPMTKLRKGIVTVNAKGVSCVGRCLTRSSDLSNNRSQWLDVTKTKYLCDIVETLCTNSKGKKVYQMVHAQVIEKKEPKSGKTKQKNEGYYNIYVILLDSVSATQGTRLFLFRISTKLVSTVGLTEWRCGSTLLAEDWMLGTLNYPYCKGFKKQPTDHYMRPFQIALEMNATKLLTDTYNYANCIEQHQDILGYLQDFVNSYKGIPKFGWIWLSLLSHNHESGVFHADHDFQQFLLRNKKKPRCLPNQCYPELVVVSQLEHWRSTDPMTSNEITHTRLGSLELNNPMFFISVPKKLRKNTNILSILRQNAALSAEFQFHRSQFYGIEWRIWDVISKDSTGCRKDL